MDFRSGPLRRFFSGKCSREDYSWVKSTFSNPKNEEAIKQTLKEHWGEFNEGSLQKGDVDKLLQRIHSRIDNENTPNKKVRYLMAFRQVAAVLLVQLILTAFAVYYLRTEKIPVVETAFAEIECPLGARVGFTLPDGSSGYLNSGSSIKYPVQFKEGRNVRLKGEAWFDVARDEAHPFVVQTKELSIKVLGTCFNVIAYDNDIYEEIVLEKGSLRVASGNGQELSALKPNQRLVLNKEKMTYAQDSVEASQFIAWTEGKLVFRNEKMEHVAQRLARWYNVDIEIEDPELLGYSFRATFIDEPLDEVLGIIAKTSPIYFKIIKREKTNENVYLKKKVILRSCKERE